jgi:hypothetical protein
VRKLWILAGLAVVCALSACGGTTTKTIVQTVTVAAEPEASTVATEPEPEPTATTEAVDEPDANDCAVLNEDGSEGRCMGDGQRYAVVNRGSELRLKTVAVRVDGISFSDTVSSDISSETASGTYATITLTVRNRSNSPQSFANGFTQQTMLMIGARQFTQDFDVENGSDQQSFSWQGEKLQPGATQTGHIVFDVPRKAVRRIASEGQLVVVDFGVDMTYDDAAREIGVIRLWR